MKSSPRLPLLNELSIKELGTLLKTLDITAEQLVIVSKLTKEDAIMLFKNDQKNLWQVLCTLMQRLAQQGIQPTLEQLQFYFTTKLLPITTGCNHALSMRKSDSRYMAG